MLLRKLQDVSRCVAATAMVMIWLTNNSVEAQYGTHYEAGGGGYGGGDERPKVQLGIRLKIPAIKFELPRFNMPKITVSAKIRQPDRPRVINLPEINLDTTSNKQVNTNQGGYGGQSKTSYGQPAQEQTFSFSTQQEEPRQQQHHYENIQQQHHYENIQQHHVEHQAAYASNEAFARQPAPQSNVVPDVKLSSPLYIRPQDRQQPIEAYGRMPIKAMAFHHPDSLPYRQDSRQDLREVLVDRRRLENVAKMATNGHRFYPIRDE